MGGGPSNPAPFFLTPAPIRAVEIKSVPPQQDWSKQRVKNAIGVFFFAENYTVYFGLKIPNPADLPGF